MSRRFELDLPIATGSAKQVPDHLNLFLRI